MYNLKEVLFPYGFSSFYAVLAMAFGISCWIWAFRDIRRTAQEKAKRSAKIRAMIRAGYEDTPPAWDDAVIHSHNLR